ncbi:CPBP family intramembrane glutamic endopeptidase [Spirochaeta isovalerica]|uniref:Membrane protease YdiL (CAAX protease family) n=1 Tax=Spirochaeta isovalerica TaxID=150 RepID=A0A841RAA8_9SPIO|nr:CPBP family intramembrane glutamic endopeptidase [Spirochaeta isovalerica]MBB6480855.1 membrane protease YdiL (CAAX protease family) [Spirochaeta isovalerica]
MDGLLDQFRGRIPADQLLLIEEQILNAPIHPIWIALIQGMIAGITINAIAGFGEEYGWRGLLYSETGHSGFWKTSLLTGLIWGIWHSPIILYGHNYPDHPVIGVLMMTIWCLLLAPVFTYIRFKSRSVIAASILHGTLNGTVGMAVMTVSGGSDLTRGMTGLSGFIVLAIVNLILIPLVQKEKELWELRFNP